MELRFFFSPYICDGDHPTSICLMYEGFPFFNTYLYLIKKKILMGNHAMCKVVGIIPFKSILLCYNIIGAIRVLTKVQVHWEEIQNVEGSIGTI